MFVSCFGDTLSQQPRWLQIPKTLVTLKTYRGPSDQDMEVGFPVAIIFFSSPVMWYLDP